MNAAGEWADEAVFTIKPGEALTIKYKVTRMFWYNRQPSPLILPRQLDLGRSHLAKASMNHHPQLAQQTGGGAALVLLTGGEMPGLAALA